LRLSIELPPDRDSAARCRQWLREQLAAEDGPLRDTVVLLASEVVTNALLHARTGVSITLETDETIVRVEVRDESQLPPVLQRFSPNAAMGRGLLILDALATSWGSELLPDGAGKVLWFTLDRAAAATSRWGSHDQPPLPPSVRPAAPGADQVRRYRLLGTPVEVLNRAWEHHGGLLRELRLVEGQLGSTSSTTGADARAAEDEILRAMADEIAEEPFTRAWRIFTTIREQALAQGAGQPGGVVDLDLVLSDRAGEAATRLDAFFNGTDVLYRGGSRLLTPKPSEVSIGLRKWLISELVRQNAGHAPTAWGDSSWGRGSPEVQ
jgi:anti-sigma regulatory factor (Ser/Thr protein kinase)